MPTIAAGSIPFWWLTIRLRLDAGFWLAVLAQLPPGRGRELTPEDKGIVVLAIEAVEQGTTETLQQAKELRAKATSLVQQARELEAAGRRWQRKR